VRVVLVLRTSLLRLIYVPLSVFLSYLYCIGRDRLAFSAGLDGCEDYDDF
jgi:hypothetical protein